MKLTLMQAFLAMTDFLDDFYEKTQSDDLAVLLGGMQLFSDGTTWDPAAWGDWIQSLGTESKVTKLEAFEAMRRFLEIYQKNTSSRDVALLLYKLKLVLQTIAQKPPYWILWERCVEKAIKQESFEPSYLLN